MSKRIDDNSQSPADLANDLEANEKKQDKIAKNQKSNKETMLDVVAGQLTNLTAENSETTKNLKSDIGEEGFDLIKHEIDGMQSGLSNIGNDKINENEKEARKVGLIKDTIETISGLADTYGNKSETLQAVISAADQALEKEKQDKKITEPQRPEMPEEYQRLSDPEANKIAPELEEIKKRIENLSQDISDPELSKKVNGLVKEMNDQLDNYEDRGLDDQSKRMLNTVDAIHSVTKNSKNNLSEDFKGVSDEIHDIRTENDLKQYTTRAGESPSPEKPITREQVDQAKDALYDVNFRTSAFKKEIGHHNDKAVEEMVGNMNKSINKMIETQSYKDASPQDKIKQEAQIVKQTISGIENHFKDFEKKAGEQVNENKLKQIVNVVKAAANVLASGGSQQAKMDLAAARFGMSKTSDELKKYNSTKRDHVNSKLTEAKEALPTKNKGGMSR